ncbi:MAG: DNA protecting protein DprA [Thiobacillus sp. 65-69]|nr:DNA-processing protein DprA [Thiobacillus sp.]ODU90823.1 MAG: DNA protecting protein DprA [Thiobacillus sp. SCN 65-179]OJW35752.1 MAG: DNA protecting protein DprA [Thiobacillus sp. 65-69]
MSDTASDTDVWLRLGLVPGVGNTSLLHLLTAFGSPEAVLSSGRGALARHLSPAQLDALLAGPDAGELQTARTWLDQPGNSLMTLADADYPPALLEIADPPAMLYCKGRRELLGRPGFGIVGSRNATPQGARDAEAFAQALSDAGLTIVSGLALGIDAAAHRGGLAGTGSSIALVGTGLDRVYPARNKTLAHQLAERGLIVSEFPLGTAPLPGHFPRRNRLISGLSRGVLVVEAAPDSGSLITARVAAEQGREVFAIPGSIHSPLSRGCHTLIKQGAKLVESAADILDELAWQQRLAPPRFDEAPHTASGDPVLDAFDGAPSTLDALAQRTGLTLDTLSAKLLTLELEGRIASLPGGRYQKLH